MNRVGTKHTKKKKRSPNRLNRLILILIFFVLTSLIVLHPIYSPVLSYFQNRVHLHINQHKWNQVSHEHLESAAIGLMDCYVVYTVSSLESSEICLLGSQVITIEEGFAIAKSCINTLACEIKFDKETGLPWKVYFRDNPPTIYWMELTTRITITPTTYNQ